jgi:hypothetical protein
VLIKFSVHMHVAGSTCNVPVDPCSSSPCQNSGTCVQVGNTGYRCVCAEGFTGSRCEEEEQSEYLSQNAVSSLLKCGPISILQQCFPVLGILYTTFAISYVLAGSILVILSIL